MSSKLLFSDDSDGEDACELKINKQFAEKYEAYRRSEELKNLKELAKEVEKYESDSSEISSSDELAKPSAKSTEYFTKLLEAAKSGKGKELLQNQSFLQQNPLVKKKKKKNRVKSSPEQPLTYETIKKQIEEPEFQGAHEDSEDDAMDFIKKTMPANSGGSNNKEKSEALNSMKPCKEKKPQKKDKSKEKQASSRTENSGASQSEESDDEGPSSGSDGETRGGADKEEGQVNEEADGDGEPSIRETLAKFAKEAAPHQPTSYPYKLKTTDRLRDTKTHDKKVAYAARKKEAKRLFMEREKEALKIKKDMLIERLNAIKKTSGQEKLAFDDKELDEDFDPEKHEQKMQQMYGDDCGAMESEKPQFEYDEFIDGDMPNYDEVEFRAKNIPEKEQQDEEDDESTSEDDEETPTSGHIEGPRVKEEKKKRRRKGRKKPNLLEAVKQEKPIFNSGEHNFEEFFDEYYAQHCEDVIAGGIKCRFKYRKVEPNNYGLSFEDILMADGQELKNWNGLTNILRYDRTAEQERREAAYFNRNKKSVKHMSKMFPSLYTNSPEKEEEESHEKTEEEKKMDKNFKKKMRKEQKKLDAENTNGTGKRQLSDDNDGDDEGPKAAHGTAPKKPKHITITTGSASENVKVRPKHVTISSDLAKKRKNIKERLDLEKRELNPLAESKTAKSVSVIVGDALSTVLKLDPERLAAYSFDEPTRLQKFALYKEKMIEMGHNPDEVIDVVKSKKRERIEEKMAKQGHVVCEQEREIKKEEKRRKRREKVQQQIAERKKRAAEKKAKLQEAQSSS